MAAPVPTLGFPSKSAAIEAMKAANMPPKEIAAAIGISLRNYYRLEAYTRKGRGRQIVLSRDMMDAAAPHAKVRNISVHELMRQILETVLEEGMVDNVLDDLAGEQ
ncbi:hypothetical protein [Hyphomicrobium sp. ghe19]|uniref:hypothetical protein n=1 Tax=Hyphomicrobium sp. ghe19 TaxID=2682968 RepID=UPI001366D725|nr:hypothetical protein HYPP_03836 [Hyphomicrobium sp. ghe19]